MDWKATNNTGDGDSDDRDKAVKRTTNGRKNEPTIGRRQRTRRTQPDQIGQTSRRIGQPTGMDWQTTNDEPTKTATKRRQGRWSGLDKDGRATMMTTKTLERARQINSYGNTLKGGDSHLFSQSRVCVLWNPRCCHWLSSHLIWLLYCALYLCFMRIVFPKVWLSPICSSHWGITDHDNSMNFQYLGIFYVIMVVFIFITTIVCIIKNHGFNLPQIFNLLCLIN